MQYSKCLVPVLWIIWGWLCCWNEQTYNVMTLSRKGAIWPLTTQIILFIDSGLCSLTSPLHRPVGIYAVSRHAVKKKGRSVWKKLQSSSWLFPTLNWWTTSLLTCHWPNDSFLAPQFKWGNMCSRRRESDIRWQGMSHGLHASGGTWSLSSLLPLIQFICFAVSIWSSL